MPNETEEKVKLPICLCAWHDTTKPSGETIFSKVPQKQQMHLIAKAQ